MLEGQICQLAPRRFGQALDEVAGEAEGGAPETGHGVEIAPAELVLDEDTAATHQRQHILASQHGRIGEPVQGGTGPAGGEGIEALNYARGFS